MSKLAVKKEDKSVQVGTLWFPEGISPHCILYRQLLLQKDYVFDHVKYILHLAGQHMHPTRSHHMTLMLTEKVTIVDSMFSENLQYLKKFLILFTYSQKEKYYSLIWRDMIEFVVY
jgi:hypothetical protein